MSKICSNCGHELKDDQKYCTNCGEEYKEKKNDNNAKDKIKTEYSEKIKEKIEEIDYSSIKENVVDISKKTKDAAKDLTKKLNEIKEAELKKKKDELKEFEGKVVEHPEGTIEMWSWLKKTNKRQHFYNDEVLNLDEQLFMNAVQEKLNKNFVPAVIKHTDIWWDRLSVKKDCYFIEPQTNIVNPLTCLLSFNKVGKFTFVEEKTFITPPDLPKIPGKEVQIPNNNASTLFLIGGICSLLAIYLLTSSSSSPLGLLMLISGIICLVYGYLQFVLYNDAIKHNEKVKKEIVAWNKAWDKWNNEFFIYSFQEDTNGQLSRIFDSVYECVKQVSDEQIKGKVLLEDSDDSDLNELEQLISRRKEDYR